MAKDTKIEIRVSPDERRVMQKHAKKAGYGDREFSQWVRRVLQGLEPHPQFKDDGTRTRAGR